MGYVSGLRAPGGCIFCTAPAAGDDRAQLVLCRRDHGYLILNAYPYAPGHLLAVVYRHIASLGETTLLNAMMTPGSIVSVTGREPTPPTRIDPSVPAT